MKLVLSFLFPTLMVISSGVLSAQTEDQWLVKNARTTSSGLVLPGVRATPELRLENSAGVELGEAPPRSADTKSLVFSGEQTAALRTEQGYVRPNALLEVELEVNPNTGIQAQEGTILRYGSTWELRYVPVKSSFSFIVWHDPQVYSEVRVAAQADEWQTIQAKYTEEKMSLTNGREHAEVVPQGLLRIESSEPPLILGASAPIVLDPETGRPFTGAVADIKIMID